MPKFSFIIPIYNGEKYLQQCMSSVLLQSYKDFEVILVDDGSTDGTAKMCDDYAAFGNVFVYHIPNGGVSAARNFGMEKAQGKYFCFVDADDMVNSRMLSLCNDEIGDSDILMFEFTREENDFKIKNSGRKIIPESERALILKKIIYPTKESAKYSDINCNTVWAKIFKAEVIKKNNIQFPTGVKIGEDKLFNFKFIAACRKMCYIEDVMYFCRTHNDSTMLNYMQDCYKTNMTGLEALKKEIDLIYDGKLRAECEQLYMCTVVPMAKNCLILDYCHKKNKKPYAERKNDYLSEVLGERSVKMKQQCDASILNSYDKFLLKTLDFKFHNLNLVMKIRPLRIGLYMIYKLFEKMGVK